MKITKTENKTMSRESKKYGFNGKWLFKVGYNSRISHNDVCHIVLHLQTENAELKEALERIAIIAELAAMGDTSDLEKSL